MGWSSKRPRSAAYGSEHAKLRAQHMDTLRRQGGGSCAERICVLDSRWIHAAMGSRLHLCHDRVSGRVLGLGHAECNLAEAARYARSRQSPTPPAPPRRPARTTATSPLRF